MPWYLELWNKTQKYLPMAAYYGTSYTKGLVRGVLQGWHVETLYVLLYRA